ncbi:MAG: tRNA (adenosine(37)-N6)-threonylcarbamoyltransferase complex ATPase subunit type 1 TsaE [Rhodobacteraceae bacterium]|nr:tRNA (adenosine(37)-N6)-threonylcarbamoyltransferase complex ATPase subunit type 1 TsaE [Paracoccaceae bacterium]
MAHDRSQAWSQKILLRNDQQTDKFAEVMKPGLGAGDVLLLSGPIGAGKSHFARSLIRMFLAEHDAIEDVPSPTFTLVQTYQAGDLEIWHSDLYRLESLHEVDELGLTDAFATALCLVEWPDRLGKATPKDALSLHFAIAADPDQRVLTVSASAARWQWLRDMLQSDLADVS